MRDVRLAFFASRMIVYDEVRNRYKFTSLSFIEFLEFLARLADCCHLPTDEGMIDIGPNSKANHVNFAYPHIVRSSLLPLTDIHTCRNGGGRSRKYHGLRGEAK